VFFLFPVFSSPFRFRPAPKVEKTESSLQILSRYFGVLSISQPEARASEGEYRGFIGFYGFFVESAKSGVADDVYILWMS
jgi:hypothetical protein